jgi:alpha-1,3-glucosyltransferase
MPLAERSVVQMAVLATALKLLLIPSSYSTDLEVHRHWKALTRSRVLADWYLDTSSPWTLDYPPLFAYMERCMAEFAALLHPPLVDISNLGYDADSAVLFMRLSVIASDVLLLFAVLRYVNAANALRSRQGLCISAEVPLEETAAGISRNSAMWARDLGLDRISAVLVLFNPGLIMVDNMHFQYNGVVIGMLLLSLSLFMERRLCLGAAAFSIAINLKHTLLPVAPAIALFILLCIYDDPQETAYKKLKRLILVACSTLLVFAFVWVPLLLLGGKRSLVACFGRLFPFDRGLLHAYWAPNMWSLYALADKTAAAMGCKLREADVNISSGHIGSHRPFVCLPNVTPNGAMTIVLLSIVPALSSLFICRKYEPRRMKGAFSCLELSLPQVVAFSSLSAFMFGWHVHEKMILLSTLPLAGVVCFDSSVYAECSRFACLLLLTSGNFGLFPLVTSTGEGPAKLALFAAYLLFSWPVLSSRFQYEARCEKNKPTRSARSNLWGRVRWRMFTVYSACLVIVELYAGFGGGHHVIFGKERLQFIPLLLVSTFASLGAVGAYLTQLYVLVHPLLTFKIGRQKRD